MAMASVRTRHLLGLDGLSPSQITAWLDAAAAVLDVAAGRCPPLTVLAHRTVALVFFENSTRTRCSFTLAARRLGADTLDIVGEASSAAKGETLLDTCLNLRAMGVDAFVVRTGASGAVAQVASAIDRPVINAGDGRHEHPTQGLLDLLTLRERFGDLAGRTIGIVGDVSNSRVARSALFGLTTLGANVVLVGPPALVPPTFARLDLGPGQVRIERDLDAVLEEVDALLMLRVQFERAAGEAIATVDEYRARYGLSSARAARLPAHAVVLHPGPVNRGLELDSDVMDDPVRSVVLRQVALGVAVRMAVLQELVASNV